MRKPNGTNHFFELLLKTLLPLCLILAVAGSGSLYAAANGVLRAGAAVASPADALRLMREKNSVPSRDEPAAGAVNDGKKASGADSVPAAAEASHKIPDDIAALIADAEKKYAGAESDGKIIETDYSKKNATSEFDGIFIRNTTQNHTVSIEEQLNRRAQASISRNDPSVLIYHTHTSETYELLDRGFYTDARSSRSSSPAENMVRVGEEICRVLEKNGFKTIHDKTVYDSKYSGAYDRSRENISRILKDNPSVQIVIDVHRDAIYQKDGSRIKPTAVINGKKAAQIMIISGCEDGNVTNFPNWEKNLTFALQLQHTVAKDYPSLMRPLMFCSRKYNMDLMPCAVLAEFGTDANTLAEAVYSAQLFAEALSSLMKKY